MLSAEPPHESGESLHGTVVPPVVELFLSPEQAAAALSREEQDDETLPRQLKEHASHVRHIESLLASLPTSTASIESALAGKAVSERQAEDFYSSLSDILDGPDYQRLALYLPFEIMPKRSWHPESPSLQFASDRFRTSYRSAWYGLLGVHDVRANFVDGDVLEETYRDSDLPRVVKAAHLIPKLIEYEMISEADVADIEHQTDDPVLLQSIAEARGAMGSETFVREIDEAVPVDISERRRTWLLEQQHDKAVSAAGHAVMSAILNDKPLSAVIARVLPQEHSAEILVEGIYQAVAHTDGSDPKKAVRLYEQYSRTLENLWQSGNKTLQKRLMQALRRLHRLDVVDEHVLAEHGVDLPRLDGPLSENLSLLSDDVETLKRITAAVETDPHLGKYIFPAVLLGGSRLKGYGEKNSDVDVSVFIRPGVPEHMKPQIRELLDSAFQNDGQKYEPIEFWLDESADGRLGVHTFETLDMHAADEYWTHLLFGGAWIGNEAAIDELQRRLLPHYFDGSDPKRRLYLERLEQDTLQYRLMHKGYVRHFPLSPREQWTRSEAIDGDSVFWDSGYRWLAARLFVSKVFLPKV